VHRAFGRVVQAILPDEFAGFDPGAARLLDAMQLGDGGRTMGYLVDVAEPILLIDQNTAGDHTFHSPSGPPKNQGAGIHRQGADLA
jgi:hypothetical protein